MNRLALSIYAAVLCFAGTASAAGPSTHTRTLNLSGTLMLASASDVDNGNGSACNVDPWVDVCSSATPGTCLCGEVTVSKASGSMDKGTQTVTNFFVTIDFGINPATEPAVGGGPNPKCNPFRAILTDTSSTEAKTLNAFGVTCHKVTGISSSNPHGTHVGDTLSGGWGISATPAPNPLAAGWGTLTGADNNTTGATSVKLSGLVTE
jgi:hypothetical protein